MLKIYRSHLIAVAAVISLGILSLDSSANENVVDRSSCSLNGATYKPHLSPEQENAERDLSFVLTLRKADTGEGAAAIRSLFFTIDAFDKQGRKVSAMRLADSCSNGVVICRIGAYEGQFATTAKELKDFKTQMNFDVIALRKDFVRVRHDEPEAPHAYILPDTSAAFYYEKNLASRDPDHWTRYVKFVTANKVLPDFSNLDVWTLDSCGP